MVIRDLTLRSAASFGSFHLIRLLYDEYMFYLVEHRVAQATGETPIGVMGEVRGASSPPRLSSDHRRLILPVCFSSPPSLTALTPSPSATLIKVCAETRVMTHGSGCLQAESVIQLGDGQINEL